jgi:hypothetical protein
MVPESAGDVAATSAPADTAADTGGFTTTAPLVGVGGETESAEDTDITAIEPLTTVVVVSPEAGGTANAQTAGRDDALVTPLTMNNIIIVTVILLVALAGLLVFLNRQRR